MAQPSHVGDRSPAKLMLEARGLALEALAFGNPAQPLLIALHGWLDNAATFLPLAPLLETHYVVALDLPGHGKSAFRPEGGSYFHADYALDVAHAAEALGAREFALLGHSMGGGVATLVAAAMPTKVTHLILLDGLGPYSESAGNTARQLGRAVSQSLASSGAQRRYQTLEELLDRRSGVSGDIDRDKLSLIVERNARQCTGRDGEAWWEWSTDPRLKLASPTRLTHEAVLNVLETIKAPVLNLVATNGMVSEHLHFDSRSEHLNNGQTVTVEGHHHFHLDGATAKTAQHILRFISQVAPFGKVEHS